MNVEEETARPRFTALDALRAELDAKSVPVGQGGLVGYLVLVMDDPDGNRPFFNYPNETASGKIEA